MTRSANTRHYTLSTARKASNNLPQVTNLREVSIYEAHPTYFVSIGK